jgi:hypothetical protein
MLTRPDAVAAKQGMDSLQDPAAQSKARQVRMLFLNYSPSFTNNTRPGGALALVLATVVITRRALV